MHVDPTRGQCHVSSHANRFPCDDCVWGALPWGEAQLDAFVPGAQQQERTVVDLNTLDEELDGDRRVMIDLRSPRSREIG